MTMSSSLLLLIAAVASVAFARHAYELPADAETILTTPIQTTFSCEGRRYGYYADVDNNCEIFHVCFPITDEEGEVIEEAHFSFVCGNQTVFDQESLSCNHEDLAFPCSEAPELYDLRNSEFGLTTDQPES
ncbi:U-scoloptoxin(01)-Cw1a-like [Oratosquilla oratoria]|uniref:U-scoloptoxin(01)-Cw1a-like n=1 Tax=Oratosquilla oratoria TaxID=337810 RepID=UPI003F75D94E